MKLVINTYIPCMYFGKEKGLEMIRNAGFDGVDFSFFNEEGDPPNIGEDYLERAYESKALLQRYGLDCRQAHAPLGFRYGYAMDSTEPTYQKVLWAMEAAAVIGAEQIVVHGIKPPVPEDVIRVNCEFYRSLEPYCRKFNIKVAVENMFTFIHCPADHNAILENLDPDWFVGLVDTGHVVVAGQDPACYIKQMLPGRLTGLHIHDNFGHYDDHLIPGLGTINWSAVVQALVEYGYQGDFTFESVGFLERYAPCLLGSALKMNHDCGRYYMDQIEQLTKHPE